MKPKILDVLKKRVLVIDGAMGTSIHAADLDLERDYSGILDRVLDGEGQVRGFVNVYLGEQNVKSLSGLDTPVTDAAVISNPSSRIEN